MMASNEPYSDLLPCVEERLRLNQADTSSTTCWLTWPSG
jgi:hypothetical protein